ncbi:subclass B1 metallo-beta-lactamase [Rheinheimera texasensis]|uniref:subclass B1 metallo-beta-lactamase n=1 Tax=Rheinheimera texasensis TaxID=306205 RepID=UPI0032B24A9F
MRKLFLSVAALLLAASIPAWAAQPAVSYPVQQLSPQLQVQQLATGLWLHRTEQTLSNGAVFTSNGLLLDTPEGIWLLDTAWGFYPTRDLLHWIDVVLKRPVVKAIATHAHEDRTGGVVALAERGIPLQVTAQTAALAAKAGISPLQTVTDLAVGASYQDGPVQWFYPGPGHTSDNIVLYLSQYQLLHGGCFVKAPRYPGLGNIADADVKAWPDSLKRLKAAYPQLKILVPGHGDIADGALVGYSLSLFSTP